MSSVPPPPLEKNVTNRVLTIAAIGMGVGFGTCSVAAVSSGYYRTSDVFVTIGASLFFVSLIVLLVTGFVVVAQQIMRSFKK